MKLGVFSPALAQMSFKEMVEYLASQGVQNCRIRQWQGNVECCYKCVKGFRI